MAGRTRLLTLLLLACTFAATPASAQKWTRITAASDKRDWALFLSPLGAGYAANADYNEGSDLVNMTLTRDGGRSWKRLPTTPPGLTTWKVWKKGKDGAILTQDLATVNGKSVAKLLFHSPATNKWTAHTFELPKNVLGAKEPSLSMSDNIATVPGHNQAFAIGTIINSAGYVVNCIWHWTGGTVWKGTEMPDVTEVVAASPTAAWATFVESGKIVRWNGTAWVQQRADVGGYNYRVLAGVAPTKSTPAMMWALREPKDKFDFVNSQTLMLCNSTACVAKKSFNTTQHWNELGKFEGLQAAGPNFALVWEYPPSDSEYWREVRLQHFNGTAWKLVLKTGVDSGSLKPGWYAPSYGWYSTPELLMSVASPTRAVVTLTYQLTPRPDSRPTYNKTTTVHTRTWNGTGWTQLPMAAVPNSFNCETLDGLEQSVALQALDSGSAVLVLKGGMWRLA